MCDSVCPCFCLFLFVGTALYAYHEIHPNDQLQVRTLAAKQRLMQNGLKPRSANYQIELQEAVQGLTVKDVGDRVFPHFIASHLPQGARGLLIAAVLAADMSTDSISLNSSATFTMSELYIRLFRPVLLDAQHVWILRGAMISWGLLGTMMFTWMAISRTGAWPTSLASMANPFQPFLTVALGPIAMVIAGLCVTWFSIRRIESKPNTPLLIVLFLINVAWGMPALIAQDRTAHDKAWKLQPLRYNHPGLNVDLGVGLWAWPMPMDYDGDGDLDLLVACPDKPTNGVYFFENPTQDPAVKMPIFKSAVYLGKADHNLQVSYVGGVPRILKPGFEIPRDAKTRVFDFDHPTRIYPKTNVHHHSVRGNMWRYVDYDGDGDQDLVVGVGDWTGYVWDHAYDNRGNWRNERLHGPVYLIINEGTKSHPENTSQVVPLRAGGSPIDLYGWPSPNFGDFDGDGDLDLLCGEFLDGFTYFENVGTRSEPIYAAGQRLTNQEGRPLTMDLQMITPTAVDWDGDGDLDLIVGDEDGRVALVEHTNTFIGGKPIFKKPVYFQQVADTLKFGALATPFAYDWDADGDEDILCGNTAGYIGMFENLGSADDGLPKWSAPTRLSARTGGSDSPNSDSPNKRPFRVVAGTSGSIQGPCEAKWGYTTLSAADWDGDQDPDIIYNSILSRIGLLRNDNGTLIDSEFPSGASDPYPPWYQLSSRTRSPLTQWRTTPVAIDFDSNGQIDLVGLDHDGYLVQRPGGQQAKRLFINEDNQPLRLNPKSCGGSGRVKLAVVDWDGDGRMDVLVNSVNATWYRNCEDRDGRVVMKKIGNLAKRNVAGHTSSPAVCDFDRDGKPDLLVGSENGRIYHIRHEDCVRFEGDRLRAGEPTKKPIPQFAGFVREEFVFTKASFPECHASTICETSRGLVAAWFGGQKEGKQDVGIWSSFHDGSRWSPAKEWANGIQHRQLRYPCWNPVLYQPPGDAPTLLFFKVGPRPDNWWGEWMTSYDRGRSFRGRRRLPEQIAGPIRCKPILLDDGQTLLCGSSTEHEGWRVHFESVQLTDGKLNSTWNRVGPINTPAEFNAIQPTLLQHADGRLQALCRTKEGVIATSFSHDNGKSWTKMQSTHLPNPNSGIDAVTLADGRHLMVYNHLSVGNTQWGPRSVLNLAISDDGLAWRNVGVVEQEDQGEFSYPAIIQSHDTLVHLTFTWKRQRIKHVVIDPAKIITGESIGSFRFPPGQ